MRSLTQRYVQSAVDEIHSFSNTRISVGGVASPTGGLGEIFVRAAVSSDFCGSAPLNGNATYDAWDGCGHQRGTPRVEGGTLVLRTSAYQNKSEAFRGELSAHELGHVLGLQHHDGAYAGAYQLMHSGLASAYSAGQAFKAGDRNGLRYLARNTTTPPSTGATQVREASSLAGWTALGVGGASGPVVASRTASVNLDGNKIIYSVSGGRVFEAASSTGWNNLWTGIEGVSSNAIAALTLNGVKYVYTVKDGVVHEAHSANGWRNISTGIVGVGNDALAVTVLNGVKYIYTISNGNVFEAHSANGWRNQGTGINGVSNRALAVITLNGVKYVYTVVNGMVHEAHSANGWRNLGTGISGVSADALAAIASSGAKVVYTAAGGTIWEAGSAAGWRNLSTGVPGNQVSAIPIGSGGKVVYTN
ncbi:hypothetical protein ACOCJ5_08980 [Knoellia sp. CPCC 206450]|uniref:hypothetical protein n=1 Tax=Knoellia tibetensis TaxID=3404798 RepID=UPI003B4383BC